MKENESKPGVGAIKINESRENGKTFFRIQLCINGFYLIDFVHNFTSKRKLKEK